MKVKNLINILSSLDQDAEIYIIYDYGDYWHSIVATPVKTVEENDIKYSEYHKKYEVVDRGDVESDENKTKTVITLSG